MDPARTLPPTAALPAGAAGGSARAGSRPRRDPLAAPWSKRFRRNVRAALLLGAIWIWALLPWPIARWMGREGGKLAFRLAAVHRKRTLEHLAIAFPQLSEFERRELGMRSFAHLGQCVAECAHVRRLLPRLNERVLLPDASRAALHDAFAEGHGVIVVSAHLGNWELMLQRVARDTPFPTSTVARELNAPLLNRVIERFRLRAGVRTIWRGHPGALRDMLRVFREKGMLGMLIDHDTKVRSTFVPFFGIPAATPRAAGDLCVRTAAPLLGVFIRRLEDDRHEVTIERIQIEATGDAETDSLAYTRAATAAIERAIRRTPEQWVWLHRRWKTRPDAPRLRG